MMRSRPLPGVVGTPDRHMYERPQERPHPHDDSERARQWRMWEAMQVPPGVESPVEPEGVSGMEYPHPQFDFPARPGMPARRQRRPPQRELSDQAADPGEQIASIADALDRPGGSEAARVYIAAKYIDALAHGLKNSRTRIAVNLSAPGQMLDEALGKQQVRQASVSRQQSITISDAPASPASSVENVPVPPMAATRPRRPRADPREPASATSPLFGRTAAEWNQLQHEVIVGSGSDGGAREGRRPVAGSGEGGDDEAQVPLRRSPRGARRRQGHGPLHGQDEPGDDEEQMPLQRSPRGTRRRRKPEPVLGQIELGDGEAQPPIERGVPQEQQQPEPLAGDDEHGDDEVQLQLERPAPSEQQEPDPLPAHDAPDEVQVPLKKAAARDDRAPQHLPLDLEAGDVDVDEQGDPVAQELLPRLDADVGDAEADEKPRSRRVLVDDVQKEPPAVSAPLPLPEIPPFAGGGTASHSLYRPGFQQDEFAAEAGPSSSSPKSPPKSPDRPVGPSARGRGSGRLMPPTIDEPLDASVGIGPRPSSARDDARGSAAGAVVDFEAAPRSVRMKTRPAGRRALRFTPKRRSGPKPPPGSEADGGSNQGWPGSRVRGGRSPRQGEGRGGKGEPHTIGDDVPPGW